MTLDPLASHPSSRSYVLKLHRDARPQEGLVFGRLESMASGRSFAFANATELLRCLVLDAVPTPGAHAARAHDDGAPR
jgi:hypothetical protein